MSSKLYRLEFHGPPNYDVDTATTVEEIKHYAEQGFQKFDEIDGVHVCRRPKKYLLNAGFYA